LEWREGNEITKVTGESHPPPNLPLEEGGTKRFHSPFGRYDSLLRGGEEPAPSLIRGWEVGLIKFKGNEVLRIGGLE